MNRAGPHVARPYRPGEPPDARLLVLTLAAVEALPCAYLLCPRVLQKRVYTRRGRLTQISALGQLFPNLTPSRSGLSIRRSAKLKLPLTSENEDF